MLPAEILVVDQSQDSLSKQVVEQFSTISSLPLAYIRQERRGLSASRNAALASASSDIVAVTDDDCVPASDWVAVIARTFSMPDAPDAVTGRVLPFGPEKPDFYAVSSRVSVERVDFRGRTVPWLVGTGANFAVRREWTRRVGPYDEGLGSGAPGKAAEDVDLIYRLLQAGASIRYEPNAVIFHERQDRMKRIASRKSYGYGIGAFCGKWLRLGDLYMLNVLSYWLLHQTRHLGHATVTGAWFDARLRILYLHGIVRGLWHGLTRRATLAVPSGALAEC